MVPGLVARIDPAVREGMVLADVELTGPLPEGARPEMNVEGAIEIEYLEDVLFTGRPVFSVARPSRICRMIITRDRMTRSLVSFSYSIHIRQSLREIANRLKFFLIQIVTGL